MEINRGQKIVAVSEVYGINMSKLRLSTYLEVLSCLTDAEFNLACEKIMKDEKLTRFPLPAQFIATARPTVDPRVAAIESLDRIKMAVNKFGWPNPDQAQEFLTEQEWGFVCRRGGWMSLCQNESNNLHNTTVYAQMRDALYSEHKMASQGFSYALPGGESKEQLDAGNVRTFSNKLIKGMD